MTWRDGVEALRESVRAEVPELIRPRRLPDARRLAVVGRHLGVGVGRWYVGGRRKGESASRDDLSLRLRLAAEALGPTYIKLGQIISAGDGLFPEELVAEFKRCRDQVPAQSMADVRRVIEEDLGGPLSATFASFEPRPIAAASIAQVHAARLRTGEDVVVKVQRATVRDFVHTDLKVMAWLAPFLVGRIPVAALANPPALVEVFAETITEELDFRLEAQNMLDVGTSLVGLGQDQFVIARPHPSLVTPRVLVMERLEGFAFDDVEGMVAAGVDPEAVVRAQMVGFLEGCMIHGLFHGDLHGGNLLIRDDGRTALLDFGITGRLTNARRSAFLRLLMCATMNDAVGQLAAMRDLGALPLDTDLDAVAEDLGLLGEPLDPTTLSPEALVAEVQRVVKALISYGAKLPKELMLFVKNLVFLDGAIATLAPDLDLFAEIANITAYFATEHGEQIAAEIGVDPESYEVDLSGVKGSFGQGADVESFTYRELREQRELIRKRLGERA
jgi:ubiquinone biosynthesis protein